MRNLPTRRARFMRVRIAILALLLLGGASLVVRRTYQLQVRQGPALREMAEEQYLKDIALAPKRGTIYDRNGNELAVSVDVDSAYANPKRMRAAGVDPREAAAKLSALLGVDAARIERRLREDRHFVWIKRRLSPKESKAVETLELPGVGLTAEARRFYPNRELAAHVLGFANIDGRGIEGIELAYDERLRGSSEQVPAIRDRRGRVVFSEQLLDDRAARGDDLVLTLDKTIQHIAERELELAVRTFEAKGGSVAVVDPRSGELLALASFPTYNPNEPTDSAANHRRDRALTDQFEPGSTLKPFTLAGAFAAGAVHPDEKIDCEHGAMKVAQYTIHDTHQWDELTPAEVLIYSSNIGAAKIGLALGRARLYGTLRDFGFGSTTGLGLPGETGGIFRHYKRWYDMDAATIAFGQGISVSTLQLAMAVAALANHGRLMHPVLVKRVEDASGQTVQEALPGAGQQVVSPYVAALITDMMTAVTGAKGTGTEAAIDGILVAGKTGTAQKADYIHGGYADGKWTSSFIGFAPARRPRLAIAVVVDEPMIAHHGGTVAAPTFRRIMEASLRQLGIVPRVAVETRAAKRPARATEHKRAGAEAGAKPAPQAPLAPDEGHVPDLSGRTIRAALVTAREAGFELSFSGGGVVVTQRPGAGEPAKLGSTIEVTLEPPSLDAPPAPAHGLAAEQTPPAAPGANSQARAKLAGASAEGRDG